LKTREAIWNALKADASCDVLILGGGVNGAGLLRELALQGVQKFAVRVKCAMLPWVTLQEALRAWRSGAASAESSTEIEEIRP